MAQQNQYVHVDVTMAWLAIPMGEVGAPSGFCKFLTLVSAALEAGDNLNTCFKVRSDSTSRLLQCFMAIPHHEVHEPILVLTMFRQMMNCTTKSNTV